MSDHVVLTARFTVKPGNMAAVLAALERMIGLMRANEPGCVHYLVNHSKDHPDELLLFEEYVDQAALEAHAATPHFKEIVLGTIVPLLAKREREYFTPVLR